MLSGLLMCRSANNYLGYANGSIMELNILFLSALSIGFIHTIVGPDHYLPFILMAKARQWKIKQTMLITFLCGVGHVFGSVLLGALGILLGIALQKLEIIESYRGDIASWMLIAFGIAYSVWGLRLGLRSVEHIHKHDHEHEHNHLPIQDYTQEHQHKHHHLGGHAHIHGNEKSLTPWALFVIFVLGPCEPLIPLLMYPAAKGNWLNVLWVATGFGLVTIVTMMLMVYLLTKSVMKLKMVFWERYMHAMAGFIIALSGLAIKLFGI